MSRSTKMWLITATALVVIGLVLFTAVMTLNDWDFTKLSTVKYETNTYRLSEGFKNISIKTTTADILFAAADDGICKVSCYETENEKHSVIVEDGTLTINVVNEKEWYEYIGVTLGTPRITVYLPEEEYALLSIKDSTGDVEIPKGFMFDDVAISLSTGDVKFYAYASSSVKIKTSTGDIKVEDIAPNTLDLSVSTGDITLKKVVVAKKLSINSSTGDIKLERCDAAEIYIESDTGDVKGSLLTDKVFLTKTSTGDVDVPETVSGGKCNISTETGDIKITIE